MLKASATAVRSVMKDADLFDLETAAKTTITLREGDTIGASDATLVKVTARGVIVVSENGDIETLPIDYLPERAFDIGDVDTDDGTQSAGLIPDPNAGNT